MTGINFKFYILLIFVFLTTTAFAQEDGIEEIGRWTVEQQPAPPEGHERLYEWFRENMIWGQGQLTTSGKVFVEFMVDTVGKISEVKVVKGLTEETDKEAIRLIEFMPNWIPAKNRGKRVNCKVLLPVHFGKY